MKPKPALPHTGDDLFRSQLQLHTQRFQDIGAAASAGHRPVAVLGHRLPETGYQDARRGRDIEGTGAVAAGAAGVYRLELLR